MSPNIAWPGNIPQLRALLSLAASRQRLTPEALRTLISEILALGDYNRWVGIVLDPEAAPAADPEPPSCLSEKGVHAFREIVKDLRRSAKGKARTDNRLRLVRILNHGFANNSIIAADALILNGGSLDTPERDFKTLSGGPRQGLFARIQR